VHGVTAADGLRLVVMGTGPFAVPMLHALCASEHTIAAVVTRPDRAPEGRRPPPNPMRAAATEAGLTVLDPQHVNEPVAVEAIASLRPDLLVVCDYGQILSPAVLSAAPLGGINLHGSLLPRHRGASPVQWTILSGDDVAGVSVIRMTPALDAGAILATRSTPLGYVANGIQIFPGGVPIYRNDKLVGAIGVSGDGVDQDDMIAFLGLADAGLSATGVGNAPAARRADQLVPAGSRLRYVSCPQAPYIDSGEQEPCNGR